jgi:hypothetical protein
VGCECWKLCDDNKILCSFDEDGRCLRIALQYARGQLLAWDAMSEETDVSGIERHLERARRLMPKLAAARAEADSVQRGAAKMAELVRDVENHVTDALNSIEGCL